MTTSPIDSTAFRLRRAEATRSFSLLKTYVHLKDLGQAASIAVEPGFWDTIDTRSDLQVGRLVGVHWTEKDSPHWELHPAGDELLVALGGEHELILQDGRNDVRIELQAGRAFLVPFGVWHRLRVKSPGAILFVTPGKGTQQRAV